MGQTADQLRQEVEQKREDAAQKIDAIETRVQETAQMARDTVDETVQKARDTVTETVDTVKQSFDIRRQAEERPLVALGAALLGGFLLGNLAGGDDKGRHRGGQHAGMQYGGMSSGIRGGGKSSGLDDTLSALSGAVMGIVTDRMRSIVAESFPELADKMRQRGAWGEQASGGSFASGRASSSSVRSGSTAGAAEPSPAVTDTRGRPTPYFGGETTGSSVHG